MTKDITHLQPIVQSLGRVLKPFAGGSKPGKLALVTLAATSLGLITGAAQGLRDVPAELFDLDAEEESQLMLTLRTELEDAADKTRVDEIVGKTFGIIREGRDAYKVVRESPSYEVKATFVGNFLQRVGALIDELHPPRPALAA